MLAIKFVLYSLERFQRGWFASPVGFIGNQETELVVGIRACLLSENQITLFSGAGLVSDSNFIEEWEEVEHKTVSILESVGLKDAVASATQSRRYRIYS